MAKIVYVYVHIFRDTDSAFRWQFVSSKWHSEARQNGYPSTICDDTDKRVCATWGGFEFIEADIHNIIKTKVLRTT